MWDIISAVHEIYSSKFSCWLPHLQHIKGHQDETTPDLHLPTLMNIKADKLAMIAPLKGGQIKTYCSV
jgi:hypothetical protein